MLGVFPLKGKIAALGPTLNLLDGAEVGCDDQELCPELDKNLRTTTRKTKMSISSMFRPVFHFCLDCSVGYCNE